MAVEPLSLYGVECRWESRVLPQVTVMMSLIQGFIGIPQYK